MTITSLFQGRFKLISVLSCVALLAACGGGGGGQTSVPSVVVQSSAASSTSVVISSISSSASVVSSSASSLSVSSASSSVSPDVTPDAFSFTPVLGALTNSNITSTTVIISGINTATPISITGGQYAIGSGAPTSNAGTITNGQTVTITLLTSATVSTTTQAVLTVGGVTGAFSATTVNLMGGAVQGAPLNIATVVTTLAGAAKGADDGLGLAASFNSPHGITSDGTNLYIADAENHKIRKIVIATGVVTTLAGSGSIGSVDSTGTAASFYYPRGITTDGANLYIGDGWNNKIRKIVIATGVVTTLAGSGSIGSVDGASTVASFDDPRGITTDGTNLYVADYFNNKIRKIVIATGVVTTVAGNGSNGYSDSIIGTAASFFRPSGITTDGTNLYIADSINNKIRKIVIATSVVTTLAGDGFLTDGDGTGVAAGFNRPGGITSDGTNLYVTDTNNSKIRKIVIATGVVTTLAGGGSYSSVDGTGTAARFKSPKGITSDGFELFVADTDNNTIRRIH